MTKRDIKAKDLINTKEVADILKVSDPHVIYKMIYNGKLPYYRVGGTYLFDRQEILDTILASRVVRTAKIRM